jgi:hypothetical protein
VFNKDTAGGAMILAGGEKVDVVFDKEYEYAPVVNVSLMTPVKLDYYIVTNTSAKGFTILISPTTTQDVSFNWQAVAVDCAKVFVSDGTTQDYVVNVRDWSDYADYYGRVIPPPVVVPVDPLPADAIVIESPSSTPPAGETVSSTEPVVPETPPADQGSGVVAGETVVAPPVETPVTPPVVSEPAPEQPVVQPETPVEPAPAPEVPAVPAETPAPPADQGAPTP